MYSNAKHVAPSAVLILILCVLSTDQTLFSRKKSSTPISPSVDNVAQQSKPVPQKETSHWWQMKFKASESNENSVSNQVAVPVPVPVRQKEIQEHPNRQCNMPRKRSVVKPILHRSFDYRCEIDLIDKELNSDNDYKLIIEYEDNYSTFVINRPLRFAIHL
ncbi:uncharacterized protein LOC111031155 isoform X2 [Myzus persicae]|uniref:uncharacterized protein LOC111031155 isoform X2 n=1 Tax=Myzus persicae TaxID=13164 RepID=UPI000B933F8F|nr:uncharacterized protein LOC111031155 isoform X2 [Myzus persicae]